MPAGQEEWMTVANGFLNRWNFPHCVGAFDGKHIQILAPENSGSMYFNYKGTFSIVLFAIVDAHYKFLYGDVGCQGRISDGGVIKYTSFYKKLMTNSLGLPDERPLPGRNILLPHVFVADDAFALSKNVMKPYPGQLPGNASPKRIFNYRLSRARRIVENVFGICAATFRVLLKPIALHPKKVESVVLAIIYLHNFLRRNSASKNNYNPPGTFDYEDTDNNIVISGNWRSQVSEGDGLINIQNIPRRPGNAAQNIRDEFTEYFISNEGRVEWQNHYA